MRSSSPARRGLGAGLAVVASTAAFAVVAASPADAATGFTAGDVVVYRVGTGAAALSSAATAVSLDEFSPTGASVQSVALPTASSGANKPLTASGSAGSEGLLTLSGDSNYLIASGYSVTPGTADPSSKSSTAARTVARVSATNGVDSSTSLTDFAPGNNARSATSADGKEFWVAGATNGVRYAPLGASTSTQLTSATNFRQVQDINGQLYVSADTTKNNPATTVATVGSGLPTSGTQTVTNLITASQSPQPYGFSLLTLGSGTAPDTLYVADTTNGAVTKYSLINGTWTTRGSVTVANADGVTANDVNGIVTIYATTASGLYKITDSSGAGGNLSGSATQIASAPTNTAFRGVAFAPGTTIGSGGAPPANPAPTITSANAGLPAALGDATVPSTTLTVADTAYDASRLTVTGTSSNQNVATDGGISITGSGAIRTMSVTPAGSSGKAIITLTVTAPDGQTGTTQVTFGVSPDVGQPSARYYSGAGNASAAVDVGNGFALVGDDENNVLRLYDLSRSGPPVKTFDFTSQLPFGSTEMDIEAAARSGNTVYWEGSMSNTSGGNLAPSRSTVFATTVSGSGASTTLTYAGAYTGLRADLLNWDHANGDALGLTASAASGKGGHDADGLNLEGMDFASNSNTLYLSFRAPLEPTTNRHLALLVPLKNIAADIAAGPSASGTSSFGAPVELDLGGYGVRDIKENANGQYLIVAGTADDSNTGFSLYYWDGNPSDDPQLSQTLPLLPSNNPGSWETIVAVPDSLTGGASVRLIQDDGTVAWYGDGLTTKTGMLPDLQKSLGVTFAYQPPQSRASKTALAADSASSAAGTTTTYTASVTPATGNGTPGGTVEFTDGGNDISGCATRPVSSGTATCTTTYTTVGSHSVTATYSGDATFTGSTSPTLTHSVTGGALDHLTLSPAGASTTAGTAASFTAEGYDAYGNDLGDETSSSSFSISPSQRASCSGNACTTTSAGTYTVTATDDGASGTAELDVTAGPVASLALSPATSQISAGGSRQYTAEGYDGYGNDVGDVTASTTFTVSGPSSDAACTNSTCTAQTAGDYTVTGTDGSATGTADLTVVAGPVASLVLSPAGSTTPAGTSVTYTAGGLDAYGNPTGDATTDSTFTITPGSGGASCTGSTCTATTAGTYTVSAVDGNARGSTSLTVTPLAVDHLSVSPTSASITAGTSQAYRAEAFDRYGNDLGDDTASSSFTIAANADGSATGAACDANSCSATGAGSYTVTATDGQASGAATLTLVAGPVASLTLSPANATAAAGTSVAYTANGQDRYGNPTGDETAATTFTITSSTGSNTGAACSANSCGATTAGGYVVTATVPTADGTATGSTALTVAAGPLASLTLSPANAAVRTGQSQAYTATGADAYGNSLGGVTSATVFTIDGAGTCSANSCTAPDAGTHTVTGQDGSATGTATLTVSAPPPTPSVTKVSPASGPTTGSTTVTITGSGFAGATKVSFNTTPASNVTVVSDTQVTAVSPAHSAGTVDVHVTGPGGTSSTVTADRFTYSAPPRPSVSSLVPSRGLESGGTTVTLTGKNLTGASSVSFGGASTTNVTVVSSTQLRVVSPAHAAGTVDVGVVTPGGTSSATSGDKFTYTPLTPAVSALSPTTGTTLGGTTVTVTGAGFTDVREVDFGSVPGTKVTVVSDTKLTVVTPAHAAGAAPVTVTTGTGTSSGGPSFTFVTPPPAITSISPSSGSTNGGTVVTVTGTSFTGATRVVFGSVAATSFTVVSDTTITATAPAQAASTHNIAVTTPAGTSKTVTADRYTYVVTAPSVTGASPKSGPAAGGTTVTITGTRLSGATKVSFGSVAATTFTVDSDRQITVTAPPASKGKVTIYVKSPDGTSQATSGAGYTYV